MKRDARGPIGLLLLLALLASACDNGFGIFDSIQKEVKQVSSTFNEATVTDLERFGTRVYAASGAVFSRLAANAAGEGWSAVSGLPSGHIATSLAVAGGTLYAAIVEPAGDAGVYEYDGTSWTMSSFSLPTIDAVFEVNGEIFVQNHLAGGFTLLHLNGAALVDSGIPTADAGFIEGAFDGADYHFASGDTVYVGGAEALAAVGTAPSGQVYTALVTDGANVRGARDDGTVVSSTDGFATSGSTTIDADNRLSALGLFNGTLLIAGETGYFEGLAALAGDGSGAVLTDATNYGTSLKKLAVIAFRYDSVGGRLYACAASQYSGGIGLWSNAWTGSWGGWEAE